MSLKIAIFANESSRRPPGTTPHPDMPGQQRMKSSCYSTMTDMKSIKLPALIFMFCFAGEAGMTAR